MFSFFFGLLKISRSLNYDIHREIRRNFVRYAKVMPFVRYFGWSFSSKYYRLLIGWFEIILGALLAFCPGRTKQIANLLLICITFGAIYTHYAIEDDFNKMIPAIAFASMLITRLILYALVKRFENERNDDERLRNKNITMKLLSQSIARDQSRILCSRNSARNVRKKSTKQKDGIISSKRFLMRRKPHRNHSHLPHLLHQHHQH
ncbi:hypothetical protein SSS_05471 [Sarcoptes scabiei]|uniref:Novel acetylcholine receptor chaperone n=1 Tax=Sarcoptes scabiei TaxID=52283 RepID=A0A834RGL2_SARSC|nr:hypothetical protein SSS_05471 [Sarcoptes scabiei]